MTTLREAIARELAVMAKEAAARGELGKWAEYEPTDAADGLWLRFEADRILSLLERWTANEPALTPVEIVARNTMGLCQDEKLA